MKKYIKSLSVDGGKLFAVNNGRRITLAECKAELKLYTRSVNIPILGKGNVITERGIALLITFQQKSEYSLDEAFIRGISAFEFQGDVLQSDGTMEQVFFSNCQLDSDLDLSDAGSCRFDILCPPEMIRKLMAM